MKIKLFVFSVAFSASILLGGTRTDTSYVSGGLYAARLSTPSAGISYLTSTRHTVDSIYSAAIRALRLYVTQADIDSLIGDVKVGSSIGPYYGSNYIRFDYSQGSLPGYPSGYYPVLKTNNDALYYSVKNSTRQYYTGYLAYAAGGTLLGLLDTAGTTENVRLSTNGGSYINGSFKAQVCTVATLNTGNGDNELYPMNQDVSSSASPSWVTVTAELNGNASTSNHATTAGSVTNGVVTTGSYSNPSWIQSLAGSKITGNITGGSDSLVKNTWYFDTAFICTLTNFTNPNFFTDSIGYIKWTKIGGMVNVIIGGMNVQHDADDYVSVKSGTFEEYFDTRSSSLGYSASVAYRYGGAIPEKNCLLRMQGSCCSSPSIGYFCYETTTSFGGEDHCLVFSYQ